MHPDGIAVPPSSSANRHALPRRRFRGAVGASTNHRDEGLMGMTQQQITGAASVSVRRIGRHAATCWATISDERDTWEVTGTFLDVLVLAERVAAAVLDEMTPEERAAYNLEGDHCDDLGCPCQDDAA
jgi:hypothetical protein